MSRVLRIFFAVSWGLGLVSLALGAAMKLSASLAETMRTSPRGGIILAGTLFLCALATREMEKVGSASN